MLVDACTVYNCHEHALLMPPCTFPAGHCHRLRRQPHCSSDAARQGQQGRPPQPVHHGQRCGLGCVLEYPWCACMSRLSRSSTTLVFVYFPAGFYGQLGLGDYTSTESPKELCIGYQPCYVSCLYDIIPGLMLAWHECRKHGVLAHTLVEGAHLRVPAGSACR